MGKGADRKGNTEYIQMFPIISDGSTGLYDKMKNIKKCLEIIWSKRHNAKN
jgi:hypothetical protein